jgi:heme-degrading monooxygenase HmoA
MAVTYSTAVWKAKPGEEEEFVAAWTEFARGVSEMDGAGTVHLTRDLGEEGRYVSFADWGSADAMRTWKESPEFNQYMGPVQNHVAEFSPAELELVASLEKGAAASA